MSVSKELLAGTVSGWSQVIVGQPFDIVKVRLQSSNKYLGAIDCVRRIWKEEGPLAFYKGTLMPLLGIGACVSLQFAFLSIGKSLFVQQNKTAGYSDPSHLSLAQLYGAGAIAGIGNSVAATPVEHVRIRLQAQDAKNLLYKGPFDFIAQVYKTDGIRGIFQGFTITTIREAWGYGFYFLTYEYLIQRIQRQKDWKREEVPMAYAGSFGALAGVVMWLIGYPNDVIKSRIQTDGFLSQPDKRKYTGIVDCAQQLYKETGLKGFSRGLAPTLIRSPFANGATFITFELVMRQLNKSQ